MLDCSLPSSHWRNAFRFDGLSTGDSTDLWLETEVEIEPEKNTQLLGCILLNASQSVEVVVHFHERIDTVQ